MFFFTYFNITIDIEPKYHICAGFACFINTKIKPLGIIGALKATSNRGLQPAMDHLLENQDKPIPDLTDVPSAATSAGGPSNAVDEDDEDVEALKAVYGPAAGGSGQDLEAKVRNIR